ncbi:MAG: ATP-binding protein [Bacteroidota bacterium]
MIKRILLESVHQFVFQKKAILIVGPRQTGKTTLVRELLKDLKQDYIWLNGDDPADREKLTNKNVSELNSLVGKMPILVIDEAQLVPSIGLTLKLLVDQIPTIQVIATGSSAIGLADKIQEPLTGRKWEFHLFPLAFKELAEFSSQLTEEKLLAHRLIYGYYPEVIMSPGREIMLLEELSGSYLYKDLLMLENVRKPALLGKLLQALALQLGSEVSTQELSRLLGVNSETIERYLDLLEKAFIIFRLTALSRNLRTELKKSKKIYFYDNGIRNAIIKNFAPLELRTDTGALWENFLISERIKINHYKNRFTNNWFWRTQQQQEIDFIEEYGGVLHAYEFKWSLSSKARIPKTFLNAYPGTEATIITKQNFMDFLL